MAKILKIDYLEYQNFDNSPNYCGIHIWENSKEEAVVVITELPSNNGTSVTNRIEKIIKNAQEQYKELLSKYKTVHWVEHYVQPETNYDLVKLNDSQMPVWSHLNTNEFEKLIK